MDPQHELGEEEEGQPCMELVLGGANHRAQRVANRAPRDGGRCGQGPGEDAEGRLHRVLP